MTAAPSPDDYQNVFRFVRKRVRSADEAEELTQQIFADFASALARSRTTSPPGLAWLYTVAQRRIVDELRRRSRLPVLEALDQAGEQPARSYDEATAAALYQALRALGETQRAIVVGRLVQGLSFSELAEVSFITEEACRMRFMRGLRQLRDELARGGFDR